MTAPPPAALHYFHCLRIVEILRGTEASTRNLFGRYSSQRMKVSGDRHREGPAAAPGPATPLLCLPAGLAGDRGALREGEHLPG